MEESISMHNNPSQERTTEQMEELQPKSQPIPQTSPAHYAAAASVVSQPTAANIDSDEDEHSKEAFTIKFAIGKLNDYLQWFLMVMETILALRFLLKIFGANPENLFTSIVFAFTDILLVPFNGIVPSISFHPNQAFEVATLIAMLVYFMLFYALKRFLRILISSPEETE
jgi:hypothetical protein